MGITLPALVAALGLAGVGFCGAALLEQPAQDQRVTVRFQDATLKEVLEWLSGTGVSYVADSDRVAGESRLTMNIVNQPLSDVIDAIAEAFNGRWEKRGDIYVFQREIPQRLRQFEMRDIPRFEGFQFDENAQRMLDRIRSGEFQTPPGGRFVDPERLRDMAERMRSRDFPRVRIGLGSQNIGALIDSLTEDQWRMHSEKGYLAPHDLTPEQLAMLGNVPQGAAWSMSFSVGGRTLNIRNQ